MPTNTDAPTNELQPLEFLLAVMRDQSLTLEIRRQAATAAAPYVHHAQSTMVHHGDQDNPIRIELASQAGAQIPDAFSFSVTPRRH